MRGSGLPNAFGLGGRVGKCFLGKFGALDTLVKNSRVLRDLVSRERDLGNRPLLLRCRTPRPVWTVKRPDDFRIAGAQYFLAGTYCCPFFGSYSSLVPNELSVFDNCIMSVIGL